MLRAADYNEAVARLAIGDLQRGWPLTRHVANGRNEIQVPRLWAARWEWRGQNHRKNRAGSMPNRAWAIAS